jgi:hypothetical protein
MQVFYTAWCDDDGKLVEEGAISASARTISFSTPRCVSMPG